MVRLHIPKRDQVGCTVLESYGSMHPIRDRGMRNADDPLSSPSPRIRKGKPVSCLSSRLRTPRKPSAPSWIAEKLALGLPVSMVASTSFPDHSCRSCPFVALSVLDRRYRREPCRSRLHADTNAGAGHSMALSAVLAACTVRSRRYPREQSRTTAIKRRLHLAAVATCVPASTLRNPSTVTGKRCGKPRAGIRRHGSRSKAEDSSHVSSDSRDVSGRSSVLSWCRRSASAAL